MKYTIYNPTTGQILSTIAGTQDQPIPPGMATLPGEISAAEFYISNGVPVQKSPDPSNLWHLWVSNCIDLSTCSFS